MLHRHKVFKKDSRNQSIYALETLTPESPDLFQKLCYGLTIHKKKRERKKGPNNTYSTTSFALQVGSLPWYFATPLTRCQGTTEK